MSGPPKTAIVTGASQGIGAGMMFGTSLALIAQECGPSTLASIGLNVFLGWTNRDLRTRYCALVDKLRTPQHGPAPA